MMDIVLISRDGTEQSIQGGTDLSLMEAIRESGNEEVLALCGGNCSCSTCHVYIDGAFFDRLPPASPDEDELLDASAHRRPHSRLACQIRCDAALGGVRVEIAAEE